MKKMNGRQERRFPKGSWDALRRKLNFFPPDRPPSTIRECQKVRSDRQRTAVKSNCTTESPTFVQVNLCICGCARASEAPSLMMKSRPRRFATAVVPVSSCLQEHARIKHISRVLENPLVRIRSRGTPQDWPRMRTVKLTQFPDAQTIRVQRCRWCGACCGSETVAPLKCFQRLQMEWFVRRLLYFVLDLL